MSLVCVPLYIVGLRAALRRGLTSALKLTGAAA
jgi:hypothetical protein